MGLGLRPEQHQQAPATRRVDLGGEPAGLSSNVARSTAASLRAELVTI
ncbi:MAG: hypothetical protein ACR2KK_22480 [Acidimicrobiales bacterium]